MSNTDTDPNIDNQIEDEIEEDDDDLDEAGEVVPNPVAKKLRRQLKARNAEIKRLKDSHQSELSALDRAQQIRDFALGLNATQIELLQQAHKDREFNREEIIKTAAELKWVDPDQLPDADQSDELTRATSDIRSATSSATPSSSSGIISAATVADWGQDKIRDFMKKHPVEWEAIKRGEETTVPGYNS